MAPASPPEPSPLAGLVPGSLAVAVVFLALRLLGLSALPAYATALPFGLGAALTVGRRRAGDRAHLGLTATLTLAYSLLTGVLVTFLLAVLGVS